MSGIGRAREQSQQGVEGRSSQEHIQATLPLHTKLVALCIEEAPLTEVLGSIPTAWPKLSDSKWKHLCRA